MAKPEELPEGLPSEPMRATSDSRGGSGFKHKPLPSVDMALLPHERRAARSRHVTVALIAISVLVGTAAVSLARPWIAAFFTGAPMPPIDQLFASSSSAPEPASAATPNGIAPLPSQAPIAAAPAPSPTELVAASPVAAGAQSAPVAAPTAVPAVVEPTAVPAEAIVNPGAPEAFSGEPRTVKAFGKARGFRDALINAGTTPVDADALIASLGKVVDFRRAKPEDQLIFERTSNGQLQSFEYRASTTERYQAKRQGDGKFVGSKIDVPVEHRRISVGGYVSDSLGRALEALGLKSSIAGVFIEAFEGKIDFKKHARQGDSFRIIVEEDWVEGASLGNQRVEALQYSGTKAGELYAFWYEPTAGEGDFYDESGRALHGGWLRTPVRYDHISSGFDLHRRHPILHRIMPHNGLDFAAAPGTTVWAAADGVVTFAGKRGPNGNLISLQHSGGYETFYAHLLRTAHGITRGAKVKQRQPIGAVGSTGRSTGPHLHFALKHNGTFLDPAKLLNGPGKLLPESQLPKFKHAAAQLKRDLAAIPLAAAPAPTGSAPAKDDEFHEDPVDL